MKLRANILLMAVLFIALYTGLGFRAAHKDELLYPSDALSKSFLLSDFFRPLKGTRADTDVFEFGEADSGATILVLGGTHCDEPASYIAAYVVLENIAIERGRVLVIPRTNHSALTHTTPGEAHPATFNIATPRAPRAFRMGSRYTNPLDQWPDPEVYVHHPSSQELSGADSRNLNRSYPGDANGNFTEQIAHAITELVTRESVDLVIDLHEASPEYPVINAIVAHERAMDCASLAVLDLQLDGLDFALEPSPANFHGLSHRELGDRTQTHATLMESANAIQGRLRGKTNAELILSGLDPMYVRAATIDMTRVPYDSTGIPLEVRVGRHIAGFQRLVGAFNQLFPERAVNTSGIPSYQDIQDHGIGKYLDHHASQ